MHSTNSAQQGSYGLVYATRWARYIDPEDGELIDEPQTAHCYGEYPTLRAAMAAWRDYEKAAPRDHGPGRFVIYNPAHAIEWRSALTAAEPGQRFSGAAGRYGSLVELDGPAADASGAGDDVAQALLDLERD